MLWLSEDLIYRRLGSEDNISEIHFKERQSFQVILRNGTTISLGFYEPNGGVERLKKMLSKGLDLSTPQRIDLDADKVAIAKPLNNFHFLSNTPSLSPLQKSFHTPFPPWSLP